MSRWSEHQQTMLREMGLRLWLPPKAAPAAGLLPDIAAPAAAAAVAWVAAPVAAAPSASASAPTQAAATPNRAQPAGAVASLDWPALRSAVAACTACGLCESRQQTVFGTGHLRAHCMVIGEAPGEHEDAQGEPFVGESGQLLDRMLAALGLSRQPGDAARQVYIANTLKCRPPRNRNPSPEELALCQPFLLRQVALVQPRVILAMGRFAVQSLLGSDAPVGQLRGQVHDWHGVPLVVTYHPAYLLRQPQAKAEAWDDLCRAAQLLDATPA